jgi:DNA-binding response OmpR family regulator
MQPRVVVVDDDAESCRALSELLLAEGFLVFPFFTAEAAWSAIQDRAISPDAIVADIRMPGLDGLALLRALRASRSAIPVVLVSAFPDQAVWSEAVLAGAVVLAKPISGQALVNVLAGAVRLHRGGAGHG